MLRVILRRKFIIPTIVFAVLYTVLTTYMMNVRLLKVALLGSFSLEYKARLLLALLGGMWTAMSVFGLTMLIIVALLTGANLTLIIQRIVKLRSFGKLHFVAGGSSLLGFIGSGCAACGLPILALLGLGGSIIYLPFGGIELSVISAGLLLLSLYLMVKSDSTKEICEVVPSIGTKKLEKV
jgi:hypothetical protein